MPLLHSLGRTALVLTWLVAASVAAYTQQSRQQAVSGVIPGYGAAEPQAQTIARIIGGRVGKISGHLDGTYIRITTDRSARNRGRIVARRSAQLSQPRQHALFRKFIR